ncbi:permease prefix domain 1-containing protein [Micromonospora psammae]|uniref:permease prefix domain 1-containing protein n=1 Tax=Micromonospora sp. CPCC 205556 TaxID=3122398 RepID=UPI002FF3A178
MIADSDLEGQIAEWRAYTQRRRELHHTDAEELEDHLRSRITELTEAGLRADEAFLIAVKRMGSLDELSREFAREHSERLWKQLVLPGEPDSAVAARSRRELPVMVLCAAVAALAIKVPSWFGLDFSEDDAGFYARNFSLFALVVGVAYTGGDWRSGRRRMDFIRFTGEWLIYFALIGLGGGVLTAFTVGTFGAIGLDAEGFVESWLLPCGAVAAVIVAAWLVEAKQSVIENMAPVLTRVFTPLFAAALLAFLVAFIWTNNGIDVERDALILFNLLLVIVLGLLLYAISARDLTARPGLFDRLQLALVVSALIIDVLVLLAITGRITEFGFSPNKSAALGENLILLTNLAWSAWLFTGFVRGRMPFARLERWQTRYLIVYAVWAWTVVLAFPLVFNFA